MRQMQLVNMLLRVRVPAWMSSAQVRREVRTLINAKSNYLCHGPAELGYPEVTVRVSRLSVVKAVKS